MNYLDIKHCNMVNGVGLRTVVWVAGCERNCPGCFSPHTHDFGGGVPFDDAAKEELFMDSSSTWCDGITILGGEPLHPRNRDVVISIAKEHHERFPEKTVWLYTGYCWSEIVDDEFMSDVLRYVDVVCDGPFVESLKDPSLEWVGSSNQHVIDVRERMRKIRELAV